MLALIAALLTQPVVGESQPAAAVSPPAASLPDCVEDEHGVFTGACPLTSPHLSLTATGQIQPGAQITATIDPTISACDTFDDGLIIWTPSPCYSRVETTAVSGCGYIDLISDEFRTTQCSFLGGSIDFERTSDRYNPHSPGIQAGCGASADFRTYYFGGNGADPMARWSGKSQTVLDCYMEFTGERPDALWGPTWVRLRTSIYVQETPNSFGTWAYAETYVPIDGDLRDIGPIAEFEVERVGATAEFEFTNTSVHPVGLPMTYEWDFGGEGVSTAESPTFTFDEPGEYTVTLTVSDGERTDTYTEGVVYDDLFLWSMEPRFTADEDGELPFRWTRDEINPDEFRIIAVLKSELCQEDIELQAGGLTIDIEERDGCRMEFDLPEGEFEVTLVVDGDAIGDVEVIVDDILFVVIGDSVLSGEGLGALGEWTGPVEGCHRAAETAGTIAAQQIEDESDATSVTYVNLACSGASVEEGLLDSQLLLTSTAEVDQLELMDQLIDREVDALVMSAGANDMAFGPILQWCARIGSDNQADCLNLGFQYVTSKEATALGTGVTSGAELVEGYSTSICEDVSWNDRQVAVQIPVSPGKTEKLLRLDPRGWAINLNPESWYYTAEDDEADRPQGGIVRIAERENTGTGSTCGAGVGVAFTTERVHANLPATLPIGRLPAVERDDEGGEVWTQSVRPEAYMIPPRLEDWIGIARDDLDTNYQLLDDRLRAFDIEGIFITEYPDLLTDEAGQNCVGILNPPGDADGISADEAAWARYHFLSRLNGAVRNTTSLGWTVVGGIDRAFVGHGYCAGAQRWTTTIEDSVRQQSDVYGTMHPNLRGHEHIAEQLVGTIRDELEATEPVPYEGYESPPRAYLDSVARPGQWRLDVDSDGFEIGDTVVIGAGTAGEERRTVGGYGSLVLTQPLENRHPAGTLVMPIDRADAVTIQSFLDVPSDSWYGDSVAWAQSGAITTGTTPLTFSPDDDLTRAQLITLLWRALGSPSSDATVPFTDMVAGAYWEEAVRWAYETGVTTGVSPTEFGPNRAGSRAQVATLLWRMAGSPAATTEHEFGDVDRGRYFTPAIDWLAENELTTGVGAGRWEPDTISSRAVAITFMYRMAFADALGGLVVVDRS